jgi:hypothetical protein
MGLGNLLEALLDRRVPRIEVRVQFLGQLAVGAFDILSERTGMPRTAPPVKPGSESPCLY